MIIFFLFLSEYQGSDFERSKFYFPLQIIQQNVLERPKETTKYIPVYFKDKNLVVPVWLRQLICYDFHMHFTDSLTQLTFRILGIKNHQIDANLGLPVRNTIDMNSDIVKNIRYSIQRILAEYHRDCFRRTCRKVRRQFFLFLQSNVLER